MKLFKAATAVSCMALMGAILAPSAKADDWNRKTTMTFSGPVEIPGVHLTGWGVLPAGTYVFKILDSLSDRHIVQIFNQDETMIYATILAIPNYRLKATDKTVVSFTERPAGEPEALRAWFYPGRNWGEEFVYPKARAMTLAKAGNTPVLFTPAELPLEGPSPPAPSATPWWCRLTLWWPWPAVATPLRSPDATACTIWCRCRWGCSTTPMGWSRSRARGWRPASMLWSPRHDPRNARQHPDRSHRAFPGARRRPAGPGGRGGNQGLPQRATGHRPSRGELRPGRRRADRHRRPLGIGQDHLVAPDGNPRPPEHRHRADHRAERGHDDRP